MHDTTILLDNIQIETSPFFRGNPQISIYVGDLYCDITHHDISMRQYSNCWYDKQVCISVFEDRWPRAPNRSFSLPSLASRYYSLSMRRNLFQSQITFFFLPKVNLKDIFVLLNPKAWWVICNHLDTEVNCTELRNP